MAVNRLVTQHNRALVGDPPEGGTYDYAANARRWQNYYLVRCRQFGFDPVTQQFKPAPVFTPEEREANLRGAECP